MSEAPVVGKPKKSVALSGVAAGNGIHRQRATIEIDR